MHELFPEANEGGKVKCLGEHITEVFSGVHVNCLDKLRVTEHLYRFLPGIHVAEPALAGIGDHLKSNFQGPQCRIDHGCE